VLAADGLRGTRSGVLGAALPAWTPASAEMCFRRLYARVANPAAPGEYPTFADGKRMMTILEKVIESAGRRSWVDVPEA